MSQLGVAGRRVGAAALPLGPASIELAVPLGYYTSLTSLPLHRHCQSSQVLPQFQSDNLTSTPSRVAESLFHFATFCVGWACQR